METCINYCSANSPAFVSSDEKRWISRILALSEEHPEVVRIIRKPEENDGRIYATVPVSWVKIKAPRAMSEETRSRLSEQLKRARENKAE